MELFRLNSEAELCDCMNSTIDVVIYGAGIRGGLLKEWIDISGYSKKLKCFVNTIVQNGSAFKGVPIYSLGDMSWGHDDSVIVCSLPYNQEDMLRALEKYSVNRVFLLEEDLLKDIERKYINHMQEIRALSNCKKCDILFFSQDNNSTSGAFISMACLCEEIQRQSGKRVLVVLPGCGNGEALLEQKKIEYTYMYCESGWIKKADKQDEDGKVEESIIDEDEIVSLSDFIQNTGAGMVHMNGSFIYAAGVAAMRLGIPTVWQLRENIMSNGFVFKNAREAYQILNSSDGVICVSQYVYKAFCGLNPKKVHIIYNGVDEEAFFRKRQIFTKDHVRIVMVGHITKHKGQATLVHAVEILKKEGNFIPYVTFVGNSQYEYLQELQEYVCRNDLCEYISFAGATGNPEDYYHNADIAVSATVGGEGFDRVRVEAMLSGCLLIANDAGAARELVYDGETGYLYKSGDAESLAYAIKNAVDNTTRSSKIALTAQEKCLKNYTKRYNAEQIIGLYNNILDRRKLEKDALENEVIAIYGAGTMGRALKKCLTGTPYNLKIQSFIVRSMSDNDSIVDGIGVLDIDHASIYRNSLVLVALNGKLMPEAVSSLESAGFSNIIPVSFDGDLWTDIRSKWIRSNGLLPPNVAFISDLIEKTDKADCRLDKSSIRHRFHMFVAHSIYDKELKETPIEYEYDIPIQVGAALTDKRLFQTMDSLGEDTISEKNRQYCEMTGIYWAWKNDNADYIGFSHYRRKFVLTDEELGAIVSEKIDVCVTEPLVNFATVRGQYAKDHILEDWDTFMHVIGELAPDYLVAAKEVQDGIYYFAYNMFIMKRDIFCEYCSFVFPILKRCEELIGYKEDTYQNRYVGFLAERLLSVFLRRNTEYKVAIVNKHFIE